MQKLQKECTQIQSELAAAQSEMEEKIAKHEARVEELERTEGQKNVIEIENLKRTTQDLLGEG